MFVGCFILEVVSSHLYQHDFPEHEPNQTENNNQTEESEAVCFVETNVETNDETTDSDDKTRHESTVLDFCQEDHGTSGHMDSEDHVGRTGSGQTGRKCSCDRTFVDPCLG